MTEKEFNNYPSLEKKYGKIAFEINKRDMEMVDNIIDNNNKLIMKLSKIPKPRKLKENKEKWEIKE